MPSNFDELMRHARRDVQTVTSEGVTVRKLTDGVCIHNVPTHVDDRGSVVELFNPDWNWHPDPMVYAYSFSIRPGYVKGWNLHQAHEDRYFLLQGEMDLVLFDPRENSPTRGEVCVLRLNNFQRRIVSIPVNVWHADHNCGSTDVLVVNFPTRPYDHANPDKFRLPIDTDLIPYSFKDAKGY